VKNLLTIDLEDWHQLAFRRATGRLPECRNGVERQLEVLLGILREHRTRGTFFVLGMFAQAHPNLLLRVSAEGHEIACHGYDHIIVDSVSRREFEQDTQRSKKLLEDICGRPVIGYRAAEFSIRATSLWALECLAEMGFEYDSSIFPIRHRRYGIPGFDTQAKRYSLPNGLQIVEIPPATITLGNVRLPIAGGGYFRLMPCWLALRAFQRVNREAAPVVAYFHPYELDPKRLDVFCTLRPANWRERLRGLEFNLHQNLRRKSVPAKLNDVLKKFEFTSCEEFLRENRIPESRTLLRAHS